MYVATVLPLCCVVQTVSIRYATLKAENVNVALSNRVSDASSGHTVCFELGGTVQWEKAQWPVFVTGSDQHCCQDTGLGLELGNIT